MKRVGSLATALILILLAVPTLSAQEPPDRSVPKVDCDSICLIAPAEAPAECACGIDVVTGGPGGGTGGGGATVADPAAAALIENMQAAFRDATAGIENYTLIEVSWASGVQLGPPAPAYHEMTEVDGERVPRAVPPTELAKRQAAESGHPAPRDMAAGLSEMFEILGQGVGEGYAPTDEGEAAFITLFNQFAESGIPQAAAWELNKLAGQMNEADEDLLTSNIMDLRELGERLRLTRSEPCTDFPDDDILERATLVGFLCLELVANTEDLRGLDPVRAGTEDFEIMEAKIVVAGTISGSGSLEEYSCVFDCTSLQAEVQTDIEPLPIPLSTIYVVRTAQGPWSIERSATAADVADSATPFIPRRTRSRMIGPLGLQEITGQVLKVIANEGPLSQERLGQELLDAMQQVQNN